VVQVGHIFSVPQKKIENIIAMYPLKMSLNVDIGILPSLHKKQSVM
jgi:hypothetical protein